MKAWSWKLEAGKSEVEKSKLKSQGSQIQTIRSSALKHNIASVCFSLVFCRDCRDICRGTLHFTVETVGTEIF